MDGGKGGLSYSESLVITSAGYSALSLLAATKSWAVLGGIRVVR